MKRTALILTPLIPIALSVKAQNIDSEKKAEPNSSAAKSNLSINAPAPQDSIYTSVDQNAQFPGGLDQFFIFLNGNIRYQSEARDAKEHGRIMIQFVVEKN